MKNKVLRVTQQENCVFEMPPELQELLDSGLSSGDEKFQDAAEEWFCDLENHAGNATYYYVDEREITVEDEE